MFNVPSATLKMTGAKSGQPRQAQLVYFHDGSDVIVVASNYGGDKHPQWYHNLKAHPECEFGGEAFRATEVTDPADYQRLYELAERFYGGFSDYKAKTALRRPDDSGLPADADRSLTWRRIRTRRAPALDSTS